jgi:hypothetical protein
MDAVRRGDLSTAQRLVDAAAKAAGYTVGVAEHRSKSPILEGNAFDLSRSGVRGGVHAKFNKPAIWFAIPSEKTKKMMESLKSKGFPSPYGENVFRTYLKFDESSDFKQTDSSGTEIIAITDPSRIKSADTVTYDDAGNVIPLSQRFNDQSRDIRNPRTTPKQFPYEYAAYLKAHFPAIWAAGGNIRGNDTYRWWTAYRKGDRSPTVMRWWNVTRPAWIARHYRDYRLPGVIAQIKWGTVGTLGVAGMKRVVEDAIRKRYA